MTNMITEEIKERLRRFPLPIKRVDVWHMCPGLDQIMSDYWQWGNGRWHHLNDWHEGEGAGGTTRGCESRHAWDCLLEVALKFGFEENACELEKEEGKGPPP